MTPVIIGGPARLRQYATTSTEELFRKTGNTGNLAFRYAICMQLGWKARTFSWNTPSETIQEAGDIAVLPCANQLGSQTGHARWAELISQLRMPIVAIGLGAQSRSFDESPSISESTLSWVRAIAERQYSSQANISVRGEFSRRILENVGISDPVEVLGCPSLFINGDPELGRSIACRASQRSLEISVAAGNPGKKAKSPSLERRLVRLSLETGGAYIVQHPLHFVKAARKEFSSIEENWKNKIGRFCGFEGADRSLTVPPNVEVFFDVDAWMERLRRSDFVIGRRIHGVMLAIQAGVPALCVSHDSRTAELCDTMKIPHVSEAELESVELCQGMLRRYFDERFEPESFDKNRTKLAKAYNQFLVGNGLGRASSLSPLLN